MGKYSEHAAHLYLVGEGVKADSPELRFMHAEDDVKTALIKVIKRLKELEGTKDMSRNQLLQILEGRLDQLNTVEEEVSGGYPSKQAIRQIFPEDDTLLQSLTDTCRDIYGMDSSIELFQEAYHALNKCMGE